MINYNFQIDYIISLQFKLIKDQIKYSYTKKNKSRNYYNSITSVKYYSANLLVFQAFFSNFEFHQILKQTSIFLKQGTFFKQL